VGVGGRSRVAGRTKRDLRECPGDDVVVGGVSVTRKIAHQTLPPTGQAISTMTS